MKHPSVAAQNTTIRSASMFILLTLGLALAPDAGAARCLYVSSYHLGYEWNDGIERGLDPILRGKCELKKFYMDGKRRLEPEFAQQKALEAKALIESWKPDVVIAADDSASKYLIMPYFKNAAVPVVFCGLNWTAEPYGYPYDNATGMIEVGPIEPLAREVKQTVRNARHGVFLSVDEMTQYKEFAMNQKVYGQLGIRMTHVPVTTMAAWEEAYIAAQNDADFIVVANNAGIGDWDKQRAAQIVHTHSRKFTVSYLEWLAPYSMLTMAKIADEQGEWAAKVAVMILNGAKPRDIPIVANRRWNMYVNPPLLAKARIRLSQDILHKAVKVGG